MKKDITLRDIVLTVGLIGLAVGWRIINSTYHIAPNLEIVTVVSVIAAIVIGFRAAIIVPLASMVISDVVIGNSSIFVFTWGSFVLIGAGAALLRKFNDKPKSQIIYSFGFAVTSSLVFFMITNFGVWAQGWYPATMSGLINSYIMAIPFYRTMLIGNIILVPSAVAAWQLVKAYQTQRGLVVNPLVRK